MTKFAEHKAGKAHFDFGETSAVPEIHIGEKKPEVEQRKAERWEMFSLSRMALRSLR